MAAGRIKGITIEIGGDTTKLVSALAKVDNAINKTQQNLRDINKALKLDPSNTALLKDKQVELSKAIEDTKKKIETEKQAYEQLSHADKTPENVEKMRQLKTQIDLDTAALKELERQARESASVLGTQMQVAGEKIKEVGEKIKGVGDKLSSMGQTLTTRVTVPIVAAGGAMVKKYAEVDKTMTLANKTMSNTAEEAELLNKAMEDAARNSTFGMNDAAQASLNFARAGLDAAQAANAMAPAMNLAAGEGGNLEVVSAGLVGAINGFNDSFEKSEHYADVFAAACNNSALDVDSLVEAMGVAAPVFNTAGKSVEDASLYMGIMANREIEASVAANSLKTGIARLADPAKKAKEAMEEYGISMDNVWNPDGSMKDMVVIQRNLHNAFKDLSEQEQIAAASAIFGKNQMAPWLALINTAPKEVEDLSKSIAECSGLTTEMSEAMMSGFGGSIEKLKSSLDVLMTSLGRVISYYLVPLIEKIQGVVDAFMNLDDAEKDRIVKIAAIVAAVGPVLLIVGKVITGIGSLITAIGTITGAVGKLITLIAGIASPVTIVIGVIAALVAAFVYFYNTNEEFRNKVNAVVESIKETFSGFAEKVKEWLDMIIAWISPVIDTIKEYLSAVAELVKLVIGLIGDAIHNFLEKHKNEINMALSTIKMIVTVAFEAIKGGIVATLDVIKGIFTTVLNVITNIVKAFTALLKGDFDGAMKYLKQAVQSGIDGVKNIFSTLKSHLSSTFSNIMSAMRNWGTDMINNLVNGIKSQIGRVKDAAASVANAIRQYIHFSEPDVGPLSDFNTYMPDMIKTMVKGIDAGIPQLQNAMNSMAGALVPTTLTDTIPQGSTTNNNSVSINVYGAQGQDVYELADIIQDRINAQVYNREAVFA